ncbi:MAG: site-specific integrase [Rhodanobacter sp.]
MVTADRLQGIVSGIVYMPKPLLLRRPSGLYVRFLVPTDLRASLGVRFLVRPLRLPAGDSARLVAATMAVALSNVFDAIRKGLEVDLKKALEAARSAGRRDLTLERERLPDGTVRESWKMDTADDVRLYRQARADDLESIGKIDLPTLAAAHAPPAPAKPVLMLHAAVQNFLTHYAELGWAKTTKEETEHALTLFCDLTDDMPLAEVDNKQIDDFRAAMSVWPPRARLLPAYRGLTAKAIVAAAKAAGSKGLHIRTKDKNLDRLKVFFGWAVKRRELIHNPVAGLSLQSKAQKAAPSRRGFRPDELRRLFDPATRAAHCMKDPAFFWLPLLALHTGARVKELAQLPLHDLECIAGVWGLNLVPEIAGESAPPEAAKGATAHKNAQSRRFVPLTDQVLALGFLDYAEEVKTAGFAHLFPGGSWQAKNGPGDKMSKWWNRTYQRKACGLTSKAITFHSFRHTISSTAERMGLTENQTSAITGHAAASVLSRFYIDAATIPERKQRVDVLAEGYDLPPLEPYRPGQFAAKFKEWKIAEKRRAAVAAREARQSKAKK